MWSHLLATEWMMQRFKRGQSVCEDTESNQLIADGSADSSARDGLLGSTQKGQTQQAWPASLYEVAIHYFCYPFYFLYVLILTFLLSLA